MTTADLVQNEYFEWMQNKVHNNKYSNGISYTKLFEALHNTVFRYFVRNDVNRYADGISLRYRFEYEHPEINDVDSYLRGPCSVLEMMVALSIRCEESIMDDPTIGDRTGQWFWGMISSLGLGAMADDMFDQNYVEDVIEKFLDRNYEPNGKGGLFTVRNAKYDLRDVEIWYQMCWYLDNIV